jgi:CheY-like chemotaxis protein
MAKVLVVDDEQLTVDMLCTFLKLIGHETVSAMSGRQTWDRLAYEEPDAVLLDIMLPDDNGLDICRRMRADEKTRSVPIIVISAHSPKMDREAAEVGATGYLQKPIRLPDLKSVLESAGIGG